MAKLDAGTIEMFVAVNVLVLVVVATEPMLETFARLIAQPHRLIRNMALEIVVGLNVRRLQQRRLRLKSIWFALMQRLLRIQLSFVWHFKRRLVSGVRCPKSLRSMSFGILEQV